MVINRYQRNLPNLQINWLVWFMVFNTTFNNISVMSWPSVLLVEETRVPGDNHWPVASHWQTLSHNVVMSTPWARLESTALVVIGTDSTGSWISNYHTIMTMTPPPIICMQIWSAIYLLYLCQKTLYGKFLRVKDEVIFHQ